MTYNEWRDELKANLLSVNEAERKRVLDYYAEAYADRRDAGFSEREIIEGFGAPYDAAKRILTENTDGADYGLPTPEPQATGATPAYEQDFGFHPDPSNTGASSYGTSGASSYGQDYGFFGASSGGQSGTGGQGNPSASQAGTNAGQGQSYAPPPPPPSSKKQGAGSGWAFVIFCIFFSIPLFALCMTVFGLTIGFCAAPFGIVAAGVASFAHGIIGIVSGNFLSGLCELGGGLIVLGVSLLLVPIFLKLVALLWKLCGKFFRWVRSLFAGKESGI